MEQLRPISNLPNCDKIQERIISEMVIHDMNDNLDPSQYGNLKKTSIQHYLVRMMHRIISNLDRNTKGEVKEKSYENALLKLNLQTLEQRRKELYLNFSKNGVSHDKLKDLFPEKQKLHSMNTRHSEKYEVLFANTERMKNSSIIYMQNLLNSNEQTSNKT